MPARSLATIIKQVSYSSIMLNWSPVPKKGSTCSEKPWLVPLRISIKSSNSTSTWSTANNFHKSLCRWRNLKDCQFNRACLWNKRSDFYSKSWSDASPLFMSPRSSMLSQGRSSRKKYYESYCRYWPMSISPMRIRYKTGGSTSHLSSSQGTASSSHQFMSVLWSTKYN